jgi:hypothetical protein
MPRSFGLVDYKVQEAECFLDSMLHTGRRLDFAGVQFHASAFAAAARSVTYAMQASLRGVAQFDDWYAPRQALLRSDPLARFFHQFRNFSQHVGGTAVGGGSMRDGIATYHFQPSSDLPDVPEEDVLTASRAYFVRLLELVFDCYTDLACIVDGQWYFTEENFRSMNKSIEDAETELGMPRGWTSIGDPAAEPYRWELLRRNADGCNLQSQFERWLKKQVPRPARLPPYVPKTGPAAPGWR